MFIPIKKRIETSVVQPNLLAKTVKKEKPLKFKDFKNLDDASRTLKVLLAEKDKEFYKIGLILQEVKTRGLYTQGYESFIRYLNRELKLKSEYVNKLIRIVTNLDISAIEPLLNRFDVLVELTDDYISDNLRGMILKKILKDVSAGMTDEAIIKRIRLIVAKQEKLSYKKKKVVGEAKIISVENSSNDGLLGELLLKAQQDPVRTRFYNEAGNEIKSLEELLRNKLVAMIHPVNKDVAIQVFLLVGTAELLVEFVDLR